MAQQHHDPADVLARHLRERATEFLRALRLHRGAATPEESAEAARALRRAARRISAGLYTYQPLLDPAWSQTLGPELAWVSGTLSQEDACTTRLTRLLEALHRLSGPATPTPPAARRPPMSDETPAPSGSPTPPPDGTPRGASRVAGVPATRHAPVAPAPAADAPSDVLRPAAAPAPGAAGAQASVRAVRATGARPAVARRAATVTATVPAPDDRHAADRPRTGGEPGTVGRPRPDDARTAAGEARTAAHDARPRAAGAQRDGAGGRRAPLTVGAAKAGALLERQLTLARTRAHSSALQALGSARFHAVADQVAVLASEVPLAAAAEGADLRPLADAARERLADAVAALPLLTAGSPYNAEALVHGLSPDPAPHPQDAPWHQVRLLLRLHRYAQEVLHPDAGDDPRLRAAGEALDRHRDAAEAAAAAAHAARTPRIAPATAYALGVLHADQRHEVEAARYAFQRAWQKPPAGTP
ncbi:CHAD domain-containing protein [Streptomyces pseudogriseolus]|uniref:CHAD domain-containing protein n=2 Tax=Streptomyces pseudogriseolus TaxID=36817 RepID=UPI003FA23EBB